MATIYFSLQHSSVRVKNDTLNNLARYAVTRRTFLTWSGSAAITPIRPVLAATSPFESESVEAGAISLPTLNAAIDILIPADVHTPSASAIGVGGIIVAYANRDAAFKPWLVEGLKWLDQGVIGSFVKRDVSSQTQLMQTLADSTVGSETRIFFELFRLRTMTAYYADQVSRKGLAIEAPPQPLGYPDFANNR